MYLIVWGGGWQRQQQGGDVGGVGPSIASLAQAVPQVDAQTDAGEEGREEEEVGATCPLPRLQPSNQTTKHDRARV